MAKLQVSWFAGVLGVAALATFARPGAVSAANDENASKVELGRRLFFDPAVGRRGRVGCADCHQPEHGFSDPRVKSVDEDRALPRHSQPVVDVHGDGFHWDGEFPTVRDLIDSRVLPAADAQSVAAERTAARVTAATKAGHAPLLSDTSGRGDGYSGGARVRIQAMIAQATPAAARLAEDGRYDDGFRLAYGDAAITPQRVGEAIDAYVRSLRTSENALDRFVAGDAAALTAPAQRGLELFRGKAACAQCHVLDASHGVAALTDGRYHDTGVAFRAPTAATQKPRRQPAVMGPDEGRGGATFLPGDSGSFKTPSLRDVARRAPYMHDGSFASLAEVVDYYDKGGTPNARLDPRIRPLSLSATDRADLVAFLESLTGSERPGLGGRFEGRREKLRVRVEDLDGKPLGGLTVRVVPCGDRLRGTEAMPGVFAVTTGSDGAVDIDVPLSTHVRLESDDVELGLSRPVPDWVAMTALVATPKSVISVRVRRSASLAELPATMLASEFRPRSMCGCGTGERKSKPWKLTRVRLLSADEAIYKLDVPAAPRRTVASFALDGSTESLGCFEIDLTGGASETIDLASSELLHPEFADLAKSFRSADNFR